MIVIADLKIIIIQIYQMNQIVSLKKMKSANPFSNIIEIHHKLNEEVDKMNNKIQQKLEKCQCQFLVAYQNHLKKIRTELSELKTRFDDHQRQVINSEKLIILEKQVLGLRDEASSIFRKLQQKIQEADRYKTKTKQLEKQMQIAQKQVKNYMKLAKNAETKLLASEARVSELERQLKNRKQKSGNQSIAAQTLQVKTKSVTTNGSNLKFRDRSYRQMTPTKTSRNILVKERRRSMNYSGLISNKDDRQLRDWFFQCIRWIKKQVALQKNQNSQSQMNIENIDKLQMKFMQNQKLLTWMYEKLFPTRTHSSLIDYFSQKNNYSIPSPKNNQQVCLFENHDGDFVDEICHDKMEGVQTKLTQLKNRRSEMRNRILMKDGKLNIIYL